MLKPGSDEHFLSTAMIRDGYGYHVYDGTSHSRAAVSNYWISRNGKKLCEPMPAPDLHRWIAGHIAGVIVGMEHANRAWTAGLRR